jgi:hemerythrin-like domain-containing protein
LKATEQLKKEHNAIKLTIRVLDKICKSLEAGGKGEIDDLESLLDFYKVFVDKCHHVKEENMLFAAMQRSLDPSDGERIGALLKDHVMGRNLTLDLTKAVKEYKKGDKNAAGEIVKDARHYITLLIQHIDIEDNVLYPIADKRLSAEMHEDLLREFDDYELREIGIDKHEAYHAMIERLRDTYLV